MKNVPIKFRGTTPDNELVFGKYLTCTHNSEGEDTVLWIGDEDNGYHIVMDDSIVQLVGYDAEGNEVYEGDVLVDWADEEYTATLTSCAVDSLGCGIDVSVISLKKGNDK